MRLIYPKMSPSSQISVIINKFNCPLLSTRVRKALTLGKAVTLRRARRLRQGSRRPLTHGEAQGRDRTHEFALQVHQTL